MLSYLELVELPNGDIVLQSTDEGSEPLVTIRFSSQSREYIAGSCLEVARVMVQAGIDAAAHQDEMLPDAEDMELEDLGEDDKTLH